MSPYRTEIDIPADRYVCLQLPADMPEGRATVTVSFHDPANPSPTDTRPVEPDREGEDMEWWEEFDGRGDATVG